MGGDRGGARELVFERFVYSLGQCALPAASSPVALSDHLLGYMPGLSLLMQAT